MKKYSVKGFFILTAMVVLLLSGCSKNDDGVSSDLSGTWKVAYYLENGEKITKEDKNTWPDVNNGDITALFSNPDSNGKGSISGISVSNSYSGNYELEAGGKIAIGAISSTFANEPEWTELYNLTGAENFEVRNSKLFISYNDGKNVIVFDRN